MAKATAKKAVESTLIKMSVKAWRNRSIWLDLDMKTFLVRIPGRVGSVPYAPTELYALLSKGEARKLRKEVRDYSPVLAAACRH